MVALAGTRHFLLTGPLLLQKVLNSIFYNCVGIRMNVIQVGSVITYFPNVPFYSDF